jgi:hypothetical protein
MLYLCNMKDLTQNNLQEYLKIPGIYQIKIGDKEYIGSSCSIGHRLKHHLWALNSNNHHNKTMQNCWIKYGKAEFKVIETCEEDLLIERELFYISELKPYMNHILNPQKIERDDIYKKRISEGLKKAYAKGLQVHNKQEVHMYNLEGLYVKTFLSLTEACNHFGNIDPSGICAVLNGRAYSANKHLWSTIKQEKINVPKKNYQLRTIIQCDINYIPIKIWESITIAQKTLGIANIYRAARNNKIAGGFKWKFE